MSPRVSQSSRSAECRHLNQPNQQAWYILDLLERQPTASKMARCFARQVVVHQRKHSQIKGPITAEPCVIDIESTVFVFIAFGVLGASTRHQRGRYLQIRMMPIVPHI
jgi:hypothetical protein